MAKKSTSKKSTSSKKKSTRKTGKKSTTSRAKTASTTKSAPKSVDTKTSCDCPRCSCTRETEEEHRVLSHLMYLLFLVSTAIAAFYTFNMFLPQELAQDPLMPIKAVVFLGWAYFFKTIAHRVHIPHH